MEQPHDLIKGIQKGLLQWYDFHEGCKVLYIGEREEPLAEMLAEKGLKVSCTTLSGQDKQNGCRHCFDYIVCIEALEKLTDPTEALRAFRGMLRQDGKLLLGMNNRFGIRYFCGDRDIHTNRCFDGVEGYRRVYQKAEDVFRGRSYDMAELKGMLRQSGWSSFQFFSVFSELRNPTLIYGEDFLPNEDLANRLFPFYYKPQNVFLDERMLYGDLAENGMFHQMANAYLIECGMSDDMSDINQVTCSMDRGKENALFTIIRKSGIVEKKPAYTEGEKRLKVIIENGQELAEHGISVVTARLEHGSYIMPYVDGEVAQLYFKRLIDTDVEKFLQEMDRFQGLILQSSEIVKQDLGDGEGAILRKGYPDMVPLNCFYMGGEFVFYDQEFCVENYPANAILARTITTFYCGYREAIRIIPMNTLFERYHLAEKREKWIQMEGMFLTELLNHNQLSVYYNQHRINEGALNSNRQRINCTDWEYRKLFVDIFEHVDTRRLILFGSGNFAEKFLTLYGRDYPVYAIIDNNEKKWGNKVKGIEVQSPDILQQMRKDEYKVLICIKNYVSVMEQMNALGITEYSIYDANIGYGRKIDARPVQTSGQKGKELPKKYHVGYISGVFDLFHVGHLNMFKRAKEHCDYLIVGVVTDEGVRRYKKAEPFVPFEERIELVRACRYVDEAVEIPVQYNDTKEAYKLYHFDCQFSGSDYENDPFWISNKNYLEQNGATLVFFPYTQTTNSTRIKSLIEERLL